MLKEFIPAADEVARLQRGNDPECKLFQSFSEKGHYGGRTQPSSTRQGTYAVAPSGELLASINTNDPKRMAEMMRTALQKWRTLPKEKRLLPNGIESQSISRIERFYPENGLVLKVYSRDLERKDLPNDWRAKAWNIDFAWFKKEEARSMLPDEIEAGVKNRIPLPLVHRLAITAMVDNVRGQTLPFSPTAVESAWLDVEVLKREGAIATIRISGLTKTVEKGKWPIKGFEDANQFREQERGFDAKLLGFARFDLSKGKFVEFDLIALGMRWGATQYNVRHDDLGPAPMGFYFTMASDSPSDRVAPAHFWTYGWR